MGSITATAVHPFNITLTWAELGAPLNGGDTPNFYLLQWKNYENSNVWVNLTTEGGPLVLTFTHVRTTTPFSSGVMQEYQVKARNGVGWGTAFSTVLQVQADSVPSGMTTPTTVTVTPSSITI